jgi:hypothetical protein
MDDSIFKGQKKNGYIPRFELLDFRENFLNFAQNSDLFYSENLISFKLNQESNN